MLSFTFAPGGLTIDTREPDRCYPAIPQAARAAGVTITSLTSPDNNLQAVFRYLTEDREKPGAAGARTTAAAATPTGAQA